jgi:hypothetical protein
MQTLSRISREVRLNFCCSSDIITDKETRRERDKEIAISSSLCPASATLSPYALRPSLSWPGSSDYGKEYGKQGKEIDNVNRVVE